MMWAVPFTAPAAAQTQETQAPLSVIDWLGKRTPATKRPPSKPIKKEPAVTRSGTVPTVAVTKLGEGRPRQIGLVPPQVSGLPEDLWLGSDAGRLIDQLEDLPELHLPAAQSLLYTLLLAQARAPQGDGAAGDALALARVRKLMHLGALDPALSLIEQAGVSTSSAHFDLWMQISLLTGTEDRACTTLRTAPHLTQDYATRILCAARAGAWEDAALTLGSAQALGLMPAEKLALMDRFLNPDLFEDAKPLPPPRIMDPLTFRMFETIGEALPTGNLPRAYAVADLRDLAGWKAQLEAAERLTRSGALPDNRLLGLYTDRRAAASGGIWDRVIALQRFETALGTQSSEAVTKTLPRVWSVMKDAGLGASFANLFAERLSAIALEGSAARAAFEIALMSPLYEDAARAAPADPATAFLRGIATGQPDTTRPQNPIAAALFDAFTTPQPPDPLIKAARNQQLGSSILSLLSLIEDGAQGDPAALAKGVSGLRALGLEDTARRVSLQILLRDG